MSECPASARAIAATAAACLAKKGEDVPKPMLDLLLGRLRQAQTEAQQAARMNALEGVADARLGLLYSELVYTVATSSLPPSSSTSSSSSVPSSPSDHSPKQQSMGMGLGITSLGLNLGMSFGLDSISPSSLLPTDSLAQQLKDLANVPLASLRSTIRAQVQGLAPSTTSATGGKASEQEQEQRRRRLSVIAGTNAPGLVSDVMDSLQQQVRVE